jgi:hypothetical protein
MGDSSKTKDANFLVDQFDMDESEAAGIVTDSPAERDRVTDAARKHSHDKDPLAGAPTPEEPERDIVEDNDEVRLKPIVSNNKRTGGG